MNNDNFYTDRFNRLSNKLLSAKVCGREGWFDYYCINSVELKMQTKDKSPIFESLLYEIVDIEHIYNKKYILWVKLSKELPKYQLFQNEGQDNISLEIKVFWRDDFFFENVYNNFRKKFSSWEEFEANSFSTYFSKEEIEIAKSKFFAKKERLDLHFENVAKNQAIQEQEKQAFFAQYQELFDSLNFKYKGGFSVFYHHYSHKKVIEANFFGTFAPSEISQCEIKKDIEYLESLGVFTKVNGKKVHHSYIGNSVLIEYMTKHNLELSHVGIVNKMMLDDKLNDLEMYPVRVRIKKIASEISKSTQYLSNTKTRKIAKQIVSGVISNQTDLNKKSKNANLDFEKLVSIQ